MYWISVCWYVRNLRSFMRSSVVTVLLELTFYVFWEVFSFLLIFCYFYYYRIMYKNHTCLWFHLEINKFQLVKFQFVFSSTFFFALLATFVWFWRYWKNDFSHLFFRRMIQTPWAPCPRLISLSFPLFNGWTLLIFTSFWQCSSQPAIVAEKENSFQYRTEKTSRVPSNLEERKEIPVCF